MKVKLIPLYFKAGINEEFSKHIDILKKLLVDVAEITEPASLGTEIKSADAVIFPQLLGDAFQQVELIKKINVPIIVATSDFGTVNMLSLIHI